MKMCGSEQEHRLKKPILSLKNGSHQYYNIIAIETKATGMGGVRYNTVCLNKMETGTKIAHFLET